MKKIYIFAIAALTAASVSGRPMGLPAKVVTADDDDITVIVNPEGEKLDYDVLSSGWVYYGEWSGLIWMDNNNINNVVWGDNGDVYIRGAVNSSYLDSYVVGTFADGKITVKLPQCVGAYWDEALEDYAPLWLNKMATEEIGGESYYTIVDEADNYVVYDVDEDGNLKLNLGNKGSLAEPYIGEGYSPEFILGMTYENTPHSLEVWSGYGDAYAEYTLKNDGDPVCPPADAKIEKWAFNNGSTTTVATLAWDGDDVYFGDLVSYVPNTWVKGTVVGDKVVIESNQFLGKDQYGSYYYFVGCDRYPGEYGWYEYALKESVSLIYDKEQGKLTSSPEETWLYTSAKNTTNAYAIIETPSFWLQSEEMLCAAPNDPSVEYFTPFDGVYWGQMCFFIPNTNVNGAVLAADAMYYRVYVDGELFVLDPEEYPYFDEPTTDIPYGLNNYESGVSCYNETHYVNIAEYDISTIGVQSFYVAPDGKTYESAVVSKFVGSDSLEDFTAKTVESEQYYDLSGVAVERPGAGLFISVTKYTDGTQRVKKVLRR